MIPLNDKPQAQKVYDCNGLSCTLSACGGGQGGKTGLYLVPKDDGENIDDVIKKIEDVVDSAYPIQVDVDYVEDVE